ncbi:MAG: tRNA CCA-pyrophosphorylase [Methanosarcinales archaeon]|nr:tRNA CCA-pyrophosphorylase [Methanosarcinales archaeon]
MKLNATFISGRTVDQGANLENKTSRAYFNAAGYCEMNSTDAGKIEVEPGNNVKVTTDFGTVVVPLKICEGNPDGLIFVPMGPWANAVVDPDTKGCGMPGFKGIQAEVEATEENAPTMPELMARLK